jgi:histidinol-phosphate/aromatic aminotransferase/cobyric acid decarboxylase-like protein
MSRFWSPLIHDLQPYVAGEQPVMADIVKLNTNENPYGPSPRALDAIRAEATDALRLYPEPSSLALRKAVAAHHDLAPEQIFAGNSSDDSIPSRVRWRCARPSPPITISRPNRSSPETRRTKYWRSCFRRC